MGDNPKIHQRRSIRLTGYDYSTEGSYFVTICVRNRECALGNVVNGEMVPSRTGEIVNECWMGLADDFDNVMLDEFQIMPDHFHGIVVLTPRRDLINQIPTDKTDQIPTDKTDQIPTDGTNQIPTDGTNQIPTDGTYQIPTGIDESRFGPVQGWQQMKNPRQTLGKIIRHFKAKATKKIHDADVLDFGWQSRFYDRIIRDPEELERIREYIQANPKNWRDGQTSSG